MYKFFYQKINKISLIIFNEQNMNNKLYLNI